MVGCDAVFDLEHVADGGAGGIDGDVPAGELPPFCTTPEVFDAFETTTICPFGVTFEDAALDQHDSVLEVRIAGDRDLFAGCTGFRGYPFTDTGAFLHVIAPLRITAGYTQLRVRNHHEVTPAFTAAISFDGALRFFVNNQEIASRGDAPAWWRLRQPTSTSDVAAELSADGITWEPWASATAALPPSIAFDLGAGLDGAPSSEGTATFGSVGVCN